LTVNGTLFFDGAIYANATSGAGTSTAVASGGSAGSILLELHALVVNYGTLAVNGGNGKGYFPQNADGGTGGRIALYLTTPQVGTGYADGAGGLAYPGGYGINSWGTFYPYPVPSGWDPVP
jgi:hypothetical protein